jgi:hypothetical protein
MRLLIIFVLTLALVPRFTHAEDEYEFDLSEIEKKPYSFGGYIEARPVLFGFDRDAALYKLKMFDRDEGNTAEEYNFTAQLDGSYEMGIARFHIKVNSDIQESLSGMVGQNKYFRRLFIS